MLKRLCKVLTPLLFVLFLTGAGTPNIDPYGEGAQYCWSENAGWINFQPASGAGVFVSDMSVSGKAWGVNIGWVNLSPVSGGVQNDGYGNLSGYAWGENIGWINFAPAGSGIKIDLSGRFTGEAWGENIGWVNCNPANGTGVKTSWLPPDHDGDGFIADVDCNDNDPAIHPGEPELYCDDIDNNCNGIVDDVLYPNVYYKDSDADGYGNPEIRKKGCSPPWGYVMDNTDCNDKNTGVYPGAMEICGNEVDDNCNGKVDEETLYYLDEDKDGYGDPASWKSACTQPEGFVLDNTDCNDKDGSISPGAKDVCNGVDDNCNKLVDEGFDEDADGCTTCAGDCNDKDKSINPGAPEICGNKVDDNCDGRIDEGTGQDNDVDGLDLAGFAAAIGKACPKDGLCPYDFNADGWVDKSDLSLFTPYFGTIDRSGLFPVCK